MSKKWYVIYIGDHRRIPGLPAAIKSVTNDFTVWIPIKKILQRTQSKLMYTKDRVMEVLKPLFPGYVFVNLDFAHGAIEDVVNTMCGGYFLKFPSGSRPAELTDSEIQHLHNIEDERQSPQSVAEKYDLYEGQKVEITNGPFLGSQGYIKNIKKEKITVEVHIFSRGVEAEVDPSSCHPVRIE